MIASFNPATDELLRRFTPYDANEIERRLAEAAKAQKVWRNMGIQERRPYLQNVAQLFEHTKNVTRESSHWKWANPWRKL